MTLIEDSNHSVGEIIGYFIGVLYFFAIIYYLYSEHLLSLFQMFMNYLDEKKEKDKEKDEYENIDAYKSLLFSGLNSIQYFLICIYSTFSSESDLAVSTIIGSDAFMIFFTFSFILYQNPTSNHGILDTWTTVRDTLFYILILFIIFICIVLDFLNYGTAIFLLIAYFLYVLMIFNSEGVKKKLMEWFDLQSEDEDYSCEQHLTYLKRRISITTLQEGGFINPNDPLLIKRLAINNQANANKKSGESRMHFQKLVYLIIFAIKNQIKKEKQERSEFYENLYKPKQPRPIQPPKKSKIDGKSSQSQKESQQQNLEEIPLMENNEQQIDFQDKQEQPYQEGKEGQEINQNQEEQQQEQQGQQQHQLKLPGGILNNCLFILFFPAHLISFLIPRPKSDEDYILIIADLLLSLMVVAGLYFLIDWWCYDIWDATGIPIQLIGLILVGILTSCQLAYYQIDLAKDEIQLKFFQAFLEIAICKSSFCIGITWGIQSLINIDGLVRYSVKHTKSFALMVIIFMGMVALLLFQCWLKRFILGKLEAQKYIALYIIFIIISAIIIPLDVIK